jgi:hypothetical protein
MWESIKSWFKSLKWYPPSDLGFQSGHAFIGYASVITLPALGLPWYWLFVPWGAGGLYMFVKEALFDPWVEEEPLNPSGWKDVLYWGVGSGAAAVLLLLSLLWRGRP